MTDLIKEIDFSKKDLENPNNNFSGTMYYYKEYPNGKKEFQKNIAYILKGVSNKNKRIWEYRYYKYEDLTRMVSAWMLN